MSDQLRVDDLAAVQRKLYAVNTEWYNLGLELGQQVSTLDSIEDKYHSDPSKCFRQVLKEWLKGVNPPPTWRALVNALKNPTVRQYRLAEQIQTEFLSQTGSQQSPSPSLDKSLAVAQQNYLEIRAKFAKLLRNASSKLQSIIINIGEFRLFVIGLFQPGDCIPNSISVHDIFSAITKNGLWDCVNYMPLKKIIEEFACKDAQMSEWVKQYEGDRSGYMLCTKISDHLGVIDSSEQLEENPAKYDARYYRKLSLKVKAEVTEMSLEYVSELWKSLATHYDLPSHNALLNSLHDECILIMWLVPTKYMLELVKKARGDPGFFQEHGVLWAAVDDDDYLYICKEDIEQELPISVDSKDGAHATPQQDVSPDFSLSGQLDALRANIQNLHTRLGTLVSAQVFHPEQLSDVAELSQIMDDFGKLVPIAQKLTQSCRLFEARIKKTELQLDPQPPALPLRQTSETPNSELATLSQIQILKLLDMLDMRKYQKKFAQESIDGAILLECDESTLLQELEVTSKLDRIKLLKIISGHYSALRILKGDDADVKFECR